MKKNLKSLLLLPAVLLTSCNNNSTTNKVSNTITESIPSCSSSGAETVLVCTKNSSSVLPFDSGIYLNLYGEDSDNEEIKESFIKDMSYYGALFDRHNDYMHRTTINEEYKNIINVKTINDLIISLNTNPDLESASLVLEKELYEGLKNAVDFSINSQVNGDMKYNLSVGEISSLYDEYITQAQTFGYQERINQLALTDERVKEIATMRDKNQVVVNLDFEKDKFENAQNATLNAKELQDMFEFDDITSTLKINKVKSYKDYYTSITLGGYGKGYAQKIFADKYPSTALLLNGGSSSIMTQNVKTNGTNWAIRVENSLYREEASYNGAMTGLAIPFSQINEAEFYFESETSFVLSTSGYYNNYFYTINDKNEKVLYHHIIDGATGLSPTYFDSASIMISDPGFADMYSTALMNCSSLDEAESLRKQLDENFNFSTWAFYTVHDKLNFQKDKITAYIPNTHKDMFHMMTSKDVSTLYPIKTELNFF